MKKTFARLLALTMAMLITVSVAQPVFATGGAPPEETISSGAAPEPVEEIPSEPAGYFFIYIVKWRNLC